MLTDGLAAEGATGAAATGGPLGVTGANGYIGREVVRIARAAGMEVRVLVRHPPSLSAAAEPGLRAFPYALGGEPPEEALKGAAALIHLAVDTSGGVDDDANLAGTLRLREAARRAGIRRFVFVSSQSAAATALSAYGRSKWRIEQRLDGAEDIAVRPGMVFGGPERGLYGVLCRLVSKLPVVPVIRGRAPLYPIHVEDLAQALIRLAVGPVPAERVVCLGSAEPIPLAVFLERLGAARLGRKPRLLPVPTAPFLGVLAPLSKVSPQAAFLRERLLGIKALPTMDTAAGLRAAGIVLRPLELRADAGNRPVRRALLREGCMLMRYAFGDTGSLFAARRWVRLLPTDAAPLSLPGLLACHPQALRLAEPLPILPRNRDAAEFAKRLDIAFLVGEASGRSASALAHPRRTGRVAALLDLAGAGLLEAAALVPRLLVHAAWWR